MDFNTDMDATGVEGCSWPVDYTECGPCSALESLPPSGVARYEAMAVEYLWRWTNRQFGLCATTIRPCRQDCWEGVSTRSTGNFPINSGSPWTPVIINGTWRNLTCGSGCGDKCGCSTGRALVFEQPVYDVSEVLLDGEVLDPAKYRVDNYRRLVRQDGKEWPYCQDIDAPLGASDTWGVTVRTGAPVPVGGQVAAAKLACELAKAACGSGDCELPKRWQTITRQGVTISAAIDLFKGLDEGKTGIWLFAPGETT